MAHGVSDVLAEQHHQNSHKMQPHRALHALRKAGSGGPGGAAGAIGCRRMFAPAFKIKVLDSYRNDIDCRGNQRATARKYNIHRRQIQKWLQVEDSLRSCCRSSGINSATSSPSTASSPASSSSSSSSSSVESSMGSPVAAVGSSGGAPASPAPALNLSFARLHGDAAEHRPPPPNVTTALVASNSSAPHPRHANYPFHAAAAAAALVPASGYPPSTPLTPPGYLHHQHQQSLYFQHHLQPASSPDGSEVSCGYLHPVKRELISMDLDEEEALRRGSLSPPPSSSAASSDSETDQQQYTSDLARRRSFSLRFKLDVLDAFHRDGGVGGNQRATARKFGINRRQVQKWLGQEGELRGVVELNRQRLGGAPMLPGDHDDLLVGNHHHQQKHTSPVDLSRPDYADSSLTPPYSAPGCSLSCCQDNFYCYSPPEIQRCTQSCCTSSFVTTTPPMSTTTQPTLPSPDVQVDDAEQDIPLCLVKPKVPSAPASPQQQSSRKDAILFKPYLDNPVSKRESSPGLNNNNNNSQEVCNLNERSTPEKTSHETSLSWSSTPSPQHHLQTPYFDYPPIRSAFVRYPASVRY